ncbi:patatin-like phospholipase family protein [Paraburkholderia sp. J7]|uniref:patatin-like phospholipase family protein n=1 Tax=Paraburkholderia sp. J7 TaxID=2805438 RepID=UPI0039F0556A
MSEDEIALPVAVSEASTETQVNTTDPVAAYVSEESAPQDGVFEIGLVLAGAISAGAFSAGVLDYLIEALDEWEAMKAQQGSESVPMHQVRLRVIAGASAGSMNGAIAAIALQYDFEHVRPTTPVNNYTNPFYESWVKRIDIRNLLEHKDLDASPVLQSILDSTVLNKITADALNAAGQLKSRSYLDGRVRFIFTQGGLRGIPYYISMKGPAYGGLTMTLHKSFRSFSVGYSGKVFARRPDDMRLDATVYPKVSTRGWSELGNAALGSGAFPIGLTPRFESRSVSDLDYRYVAIPDDRTGKLRYCQILPAWTQTVNGVNHPAPDPYCEYVVDGGTMDNEPLDMARTELAGLVGFNDRNGETDLRAHGPRPHAVAAHRTIATDSARRDPAI